MHTVRLTVDPARPDKAVMARAGAVIRSGGLVAFPTETVYGLGANALDAAAVARIFAAKERPAHDPIIVHVTSIDRVTELVSTLPKLAQRLAARFWPGALTLVLPRSTRVPDVVTAGGATVAVRCPSHPLARALLDAAEVPIAAPSANRFSRTSPTTAQHVWDDLAGRIDMILDGGPTSIGVESTVLDLTHTPPRLLRPGGVTLEELHAVIGAIETDSFQATSITPESGHLPSPGLLERHYAPHATLHLFTGAVQTRLSEICRLADDARRAGARVGIMAAEELIATFTDHADAIVSLGPLAADEPVARHLYAAMRTLDAQQMDVIIAHEIDAAGLGLAVNDRLRRAAETIHETPLKDSLE